MVVPLVPIFIASAIGSSLPQFLIDQGISTGVNQSRSLIKKVINKFTSKTMGKELFKDKLIDLTVEEFTSLLNEELQDLKTVFEEVLREERPEIGEETVFRVITEALQAINITLSKLTKSNQELPALIEQIFTQNQEWLTKELMETKNDVIQALRQLNQEQSQDLLQQFQKSISQELIETNELLKKIEERQIQTQNSINQLHLEVQWIRQYLEKGKEKPQTAELRKAYTQIWEGIECPACGAMLSYSKGQQSITCHYCGNTFSPQQLLKRHNQYKEELSRARLLSISALQIGSVVMSSKNDIEYDPEKYVNRRDVENIFQQFLEDENEENFFLLLGEAGFGKTWLAAHLAHETLTKHKIPTFYFPLRLNLQDHIMQPFYFKKDIYKVLEDLKTFANNTKTKILLVLDGYDEIPDDKQKRFIIGYFFQTLRKNPYIKIFITSRTYDWNECSMVIENLPNWRPVLWQPPSIKSTHLFNEKSYSYILQEFTLQETQQAITKYRLPPLDQWPEELKPLAKYPLWLRFLHQYTLEKHAFPKNMSIELIEAYLKRMRITSNDMIELYKLTNQILTKKTIHTLNIDYLPEHTRRKLYSSGIIQDATMVGLVSFTSPNIANYLIATQIIRHHISKEKKQEQHLITQTKELPQEWRQQVQDYVIQLCKKYRIPVLVFLKHETLKQQTLDFQSQKPLPPPNKTQTINKPHTTIISQQQAPPTAQLSLNEQELIDIIQLLTESYGTKTIPIKTIAEYLQENVITVLRTLTNLIRENIIEAKIDGKGTPSIEDDQLVLAEQWDNLSHTRKTLENIQSTLEKGDLQKTLELIENALKDQRIINSYKETLKEKQQQIRQTIYEQEKNELFQLLSQQEAKGETISALKTIETLLQNPTNSPQERQVLQEKQQYYQQRQHVQETLQISEQLLQKKEYLKALQQAKELLNQTLTPEEHALATALITRIKQTQTQEYQQKIQKITMLIEKQKYHEALEKANALKNKVLTTTQQQALQALTQKIQQLQKKQLEEEKKKQEIQKQLQSQLDRLKQALEAHQYSAAQELLQQATKTLNKHHSYLDHEELQAYQGQLVQAQEKINNALKPAKYNGAKLHAFEAQALQKIEKHVGTKLPLLTTTSFDWNTFGFYVEDKKVKHLGLYGGKLPAKLKEAPTEITHLKNLTKLTLASNLLKSLPENIGNLKNLQELRISNNKLESLPENIGNLENIQILDISFNELTSLPENIENLENLQILKIYSNQLKSLPETIGNLKNLQELWIFNNKLESLPETIGNLKNLQRLEIQGNKLVSLPESLWSLKNLQVLILGGNPLKSLPETIGNLEKLQELWISNNKLESLPENIGNLKNLQHLEIQGNKLVSLPKSLINLGELKELYCRSNSFDEKAKKLLRRLEQKDVYVDCL